MKVFASDVTSSSSKPYIPGYEHSETIDFLMATPNNFPIPNAPPTQGFFEAFFSGNINDYFKKHMSLLLGVGKMASSGLVSSLTHTDFYTALPHAFGTDHAATLRITPCVSTFNWPKLPTATMYRDRLTQYLQKNDLCFHMQALQFIDQKQTPIEDATTVWTENSHNKWTTIATITIPKQAINIDEDFCIKTTYNPWNIITEHKPLGGIHRTRGYVYQQAQSLRQHLVGDPVQERTWAQIQAARKNGVAHTTAHKPHKVKKTEGDMDEGEVDEAELDEAHHEHQQHEQHHHNNHNQHHASVNVEVNVQ